MKKTSLMLIVVLVVSLFTPVCAQAADNKETVVYSSESVKIKTSHSEELGRIAIVEKANDETITFYKDGCYYKALYENGFIDIIAYDVEIDTAFRGVESRDNGNFQKPNVKQYAGWTYLYSHRMETYIDWDSLNRALEGIYIIADIIIEISVVLMIPVVAAAFAFNTQAEKIYREEDSYADIMNPLYFMVKVFFYQNSSFTTLIPGEGNPKTEYYNFG